MMKKPSERMSLAEVRRRPHPLLTQPRHTLFPAELFTESEVSRVRDEASVTRVIPKVPALPEEPDTEDVSAPAGGALAADPGPLPFATDDEPPHRAGAPERPDRPGNPPDAKRSSLWPSWLPRPSTELLDRSAGNAHRAQDVLAAAVVVFVLAAALGFALTRLLAG